MPHVKQDLSSKYNHMEEKTKTGVEGKDAVSQTPKAAPVASTRGEANTPSTPNTRGGFRGGQRGPRPLGRDGKPRTGGGGRGGRDGKHRDARQKPEYDQKSIEVRRVARVVAGGRRFSFSVAMIIGDRKGKVGVGTGKAGDVSGAMEKAAKDAKKHMITVKTTKKNSIPHQVEAKYSSGYVMIIPSPDRGLVAGSAVRNVLELAGITDVSAKIHSGSKNKLNIARATVKALEMIRPRTPRTK
jgi:small subunit ribosomal protein S5